MLVNIHIDFQALGFLTVVGFMGDIGLLLVNPSGVETIEASRMSLNCCWPSHLPACLYNLLMFSRHSGSYIYNCCLRMGEYQWSVHDILGAVIETYLLARQIVVQMYELREQNQSP